MILFSVRPSTFALSQEETKKLPHISPYQAYVLFQQGKIIILDVHNLPNKKHASIIGAFYIPYQKIKTSRIKLPRNKIIGVYCG